MEDSKGGSKYFLEILFNFSFKIGGKNFLSTVSNRYPILFYNLERKHENIVKNWIPRNFFLKPIRNDKERDP